MKINSILKKPSLITLALVLLLVIISVAFLWKDTFYFENVGALNHSLELSYFATSTLFDGPLHINQEIKDVPVTPSVVMWAYPPGIYALMNVTYNIFGFKTTNVNLVFLILQLLAVVLAFLTFKKIVNKFASFVLALFVLAFVANITILPDFFLLPFLILVFTLLFYFYPQAMVKPNPLTLVFLGVLVGLITFIKHNTGLMLFVALSSYIFFSSLQYESQDKSESKTGWILVPVIVAIHVIFGIVFLLQVESVTTALYYLLPFVLFLLSFIYYILFKNKNLYLKVRIFLRNFALFAVPFVVIVAAWIIWFSLTVGFSRYIQSLYGMYSGFTGVWDVGILKVFSRVFNFEGFGSISAIGNTIYSLFSACLVFIPFIAALISAATISINLLKNNIEKIKKYLGICILGIMGIFFLYPIESGHNIVSRIFLFVFILFFLLAQTKLFTRRNTLIIFSVLLVFIVPLLVNNIGASIRTVGGDYAAISDKVNTKISSELAREINRATDLINTATERNKYYIIDSYSELCIYYYLTDVNQKNYFLEMRPGILDKKVAAEIINAITDYQYLVINKKQYDNFLKGDSYNPDLDELLYYIGNNYVIKDTFIKNLMNDDEQLVDFYIMAKATL